MSYEGCPSCKKTFMGGNSGGTPETSKCPFCKTLHRRFKILIEVEVNSILARDLQHATELITELKEQSKHIKKIIEVSEDP